MTGTTGNFPNFSMIFIFFSYFFKIFSLTLEFGEKTKDKMWGAYCLPLESAC